MLSLPKSNNFMNKQELRAAISIGLLYVIRMLGLFMILPVLPAVGADLELATPLLIGLALGVYGLSQAVLQIPMGLLSDKFGRKPVILAGLLMFIFGSLVAANADTIIGVIFGRLLQGCGAIASALLALLSDVTRVDQRSSLFHRLCGLMMNDPLRQHWIHLLTLAPTVFTLAFAVR